MLRTAKQIAQVFDISYQVAMNTLRENEIPFLLCAKGNVKPIKMFEITDEEFKAIRERLYKIKETNPLSPYLSVLLTPYWSIYIPYTLDEHPMEVIELNVELSHHPDLIRKLNELMILTPNTGFEEKLAEIAAHCNIFAGKDQKDIATLCTKRLQEMRTGILQVIN